MIGREDSNEPFTANDADRLEQQTDIVEEPDSGPDEPIGTVPREANEADVVEQGQTVSGDDDYPRGPLDEEPS